MDTKEQQFRRRVSSPSRVTSSSNNIGYRWNPCQDTKDDEEEEEEEDVVVAASLGTVATSAASYLLQQISAKTNPEMAPPLWSLLDVVATETKRRSAERIAKGRVRSWTGNCENSEVADRLLREKMDKLEADYSTDDQSLASTEATSSACLSPVSNASWVAYWNGAGSDSEENSSRATRPELLAPALNAVLESISESGTNVAEPPSDFAFVSESTAAIYNPQVVLTTPECVPRTLCPAARKSLLVSPPAATRTLSTAAIKNKQSLIANRRALSSGSFNYGTLKVDTIVPTYERIWSIATGDCNPTSRTSTSPKTPRSPRPTLMVPDVPEPEYDLHIHLGTMSDDFCTNKSY
jgi:hypothetical protein